MPSQREKYYLTPVGLEKLKKRQKLILEARSSKDNDTDDLARINDKLKEISLILKNYELITPPSKDKQKIVALGATVVVQVDGQTDELTIVGTMEANPSLGKISNESPVGKALLGRKVGDEVVISSSIKSVYKIKGINYLNE